MSPKVVFSPEAEDDLLEIAHYSLAQWGEAQSEKYVDQLLASMRLLAEFPSLGPIRDDLLPSCRAHPVDQHLILYRPIPVGIEVVRIVHAKMDVKRQLRSG